MSWGPQSGPPCTLEYPMAGNHIDGSQVYGESLSISCPEWSGSGSLTIPGSLSEILISAPPQTYGLRTCALTSLPGDTCKGLAQQPPTAEVSAIILGIPRQLGTIPFPCLRLRQAKTMCSLISSCWKDPSEWEWDISVVSISRKFKPLCTPHVTLSVSGLMKLSCEVTVSIIDLMDPGDLVFTVRNTERRRRINTMLRAKANAFQVAQCALFACDADGNIRECNTAFCEMFDLKDEEDARRALV